MQNRYTFKARKWASCLVQDAFDVVMVDNETNKQYFSSSTWETLELAEGTAKNWTESYANASDLFIEMTIDYWKEEGVAA